MRIPLLSMSKKVKKASFWVRRRSHLPILIIGTLVVLVLYFNEETSMALNMQYDKEITELKKAIALEKDSMEYYRSRHKAVLEGRSDLEHLAREQYQMQRPTEDVYIIHEHQ